MKFTVALLFLSAFFAAAVSGIPIDEGQNIYQHLKPFELISSSNGEPGSLGSYGD